MIVQNVDTAGLNYQLVDAKGQVVGRLASQLARLLQVRLCWQIPVSDAAVHRKCCNGWGLRAGVVNACPCCQTAGWTFWGSVIALPRPKPCNFCIRAAVLWSSERKWCTRVQGKDQPTYTPHEDVGNVVVVINARHVELTGRKWDRKLYRWHTG